MNRIEANILHHARKQREQRRLNNLKNLKHKDLKDEKIMDREEIYNQVIQEYSELINNGETWTTPTGDNIQDIIGNLVDLVMKYGQEVYDVVDLDDYTLEQLMDYEYLESKIKILIN